METPPPTWPTPDAVTAQRDSLAEAVAAVQEASLRETGTSVAMAGSLAEAQLAALGGVYVAYPTTGPSANPERDQADATATASAEPEPSMRQTIDSLRALAAQTATAAADPTLTALARAIDISWAQFDWLSHAPTTDASVTRAPIPFPTGPGQAAASDDAGATASATETPTPTGAASSEPATGAGAFAPGSSTAVSGETAASLALAHDRARYVYETIAANSQGGEREAALKRALDHAARSDALASHASDDPRTPLYQLRDVDLLTEQGRRSAAAAAETELTNELELLTVTAHGGDVTWILNDFFDCWTAAFETQAAAGGSVPPLDALPGIDEAP